MVQLQMVIEIKEGKMSITLNNLAREDANDTEREVAAVFEKAVEEILRTVNDQLGLCAIIETTR